MISPSLARFFKTSYLLFLGVIGAQVSAESTPTHSEQDWLTGQGINFGGVLFPHFHFQAAYGGTSANEPTHLAAGHHDPEKDGWTIQGFEIGASLRWTDYIEGYGSLHVYQEAASRTWDSKFDEWYLKLKNLPGGIEIRGGRFLSHIGLHNSTHLHGWDFIDNSLVNGHFLGDDGLSVIGGEINWRLPTPWTSFISVSVGEAQNHGAHEHSHHRHENAVDPHQLGLDGMVTTADWTHAFHYNDFHQFRAGLSGVWGENTMGLGSRVYGIHFQYEWRENGLEPGGKYFRWRTEAYLRNMEYFVESGHADGEITHAHDDHADEMHHHGHGEESHSEDHAEEEEPKNQHDGQKHRSNQFGAYTSLVYGFANGMELGLRADYVEAVTRASLPQRFRLSPNVTYYLNEAKTLYLRAQYNYDHSPRYKDEHSVWMQFGVNWGGNH